MNVRNKYLNDLIKTLVVVLLLWVLYRQVFGRENIAEIWAVFQQKLMQGNQWYLIATILLMPLNWLFETLKWRVLIRKFEQHSVWQSYKAILSGVTFSIFTPNRIGEYGGRILLVKPENNWKAVVATLVGSFSQLLALLSMGLLGLVYFVSHFWEVETFALRGIEVIGFALIALMLFCFYNIDLIIPIAKRIPYIHKLKRFVKDVSVLKTYGNRELTGALFYAYARYFTYALQYYLLLLFFGIQVSAIAAFGGIATIFLVQTSIPLPPLWDLLARGEVALQIWGLFDANEISILAATFSLWVINLIIPSLIGTIFIININVLKSLGYGQDNVKKEDKKELLEATKKP